MDDSPDTDVQFSRAWDEHRRYLLDIAFRTLGNVGDAEDVVQNAYARLVDVDIDEIHDVRAWLVVVVGRSPAACRQLASRARSHLRTDADAPRFAIESADERHICDEFIAACATGDVDRLLAVLDPDVAGQVDMGGTIGLRPPVVGSLAIAKTALHFWGPASGTILHSIPTDRDAGLIALRDGQLVGTFAFTLRGGLLHHIHTVVDPAKLAPLAEKLGAKRP